MFPIFICVALATNYCVVFYKPINTVIVIVIVINKAIKINTKHFDTWKKGFKLQSESPVGATGFPILCLEMVFPV